MLLQIVNSHNVQFLKLKIMKRKFTQICFVVMCMLFSVKNYAATITATVSGNWSSAATWSGGTAGATVGGLDNIVIPAGITVTLDMDVQVTSVLSSISVSGNLNSTASHSLMINSGTLSGNGAMNLYYLELGTVGGMSFTGGLTVNRFVSSNTSLTLGAQVNLVDTICLKAGTLTLGNGSILNLGTNSNIKVDDGSLAISGGVFMGTNAYNIMYVGNTKTTGIEWNGTGATNAYVQLSSASQSLTLAGDMTINGTLYHNMGILQLNGNMLTLKGDYMSMNNAMIAGSQTSDLMVDGSNSLTSDLMFATGAQTLNDFHINMASAVNIAHVSTDLTIYGDLYLEQGNVNMTNNSTIKMNAGSGITEDYGSLILASGSSFDGTASYNVHYIGNGKLGGVELSGSGLNNLNVDLASHTYDVMLSSDLTVNGTLMLNKGSLGLNAHNLEIKGDLSSQANGHIKGDAASDLTINTTAGLGDTLAFYGAATMTLHNLSINTGNGSNVMLGSALTLENMSFEDGGITIYNDDLTLNSTGAITGYDMNNYVAIKGTGSLMMNVNASSPYVTFPVGTTTSYAPAHIQKITGTNGMMGVSTHNGVWANGTSGSNYASMASIVDRTWDVTSATSGSMNYNMKLEWGTAMEVNSFDRNNAYISQYAAGWDAMAATSATATGSGMYMMQRNGLTSTGQFAVVDNLSSVGIAEMEAVNVSFYPNPATEAVTMTVKNLNAYTIEVFDAVGNTVISKTIATEPSTKIDLSTLNTGVYFVKISDGNSQNIKKIVKQ
jgi:hypothetical protein